MSSGVGSGAQFVLPLIGRNGQSNKEGRDLTVPGGYAPNARVRWYDVSGGPQAYPYPNAVAGAHALDLTMNDALCAATPGAALLFTGGVAIGGTNLIDWTTGGLAGQLLTAVNFLKAASPNNRRVAWIDQRCENEAQGAPGSSPGTVTADYVTLFNNIQAYFGSDYLIVPYLVALNPNCPNIGNTGLAPNTAAVRAQQAAFVAGYKTPFARYITDFDGSVPACNGGLHWCTGQTLPQGPIVANYIIADFQNL